MKPTNLNDFIKRYLAGESANQLAKEIGVKCDTLLNWFRQANVQLRSKAEAMAGDRHRLDDVDICNRYLAGESTNAIAISLGVGRRAVDRRLVRNGVELRSQSSAETLKWSRMTDKQRIRQTQAAHASIVGRYEIDILYALSLAGHRFAKQQVGKYHVDLTHHSLLIAVEIETRDSFLSKHRRCRIKYLLDQGWALLYLRVNGRLRLPEVTRKVIAFLDLARRDKSVYGKYGVINCKGQSSPLRRAKLDDFSRVTGF